MTTRHGGSGTSARRPEIELSWRRSRMCGVHPEFHGFTPGAVAEFDPRSRLLEAASTVIDQLSATLAGSSYSLLLADRECRLVYRWFDDPRFESALDALGVRDGVSLAEDVVGTNALGTVLETRRGIVVDGAEHFIEPFKQFTCYGHPIWHPVTRRLEGVLDITCADAPASPLLAPFLTRAAADIEQLLLDQAKASERVLLAAFQSVSGQRRAIAAIGDDIVLTNKAALDLLGPSDYAVLRIMAEEATGRPSSTEVAVASGARVRVRVMRVPGAGVGTLFHFDPVEGSRAVPAIAPRDCCAGAVEVVPDLVLVTGERGTGRSTEARRLARADEVEFHNCSDLAAVGERQWVCRLTERLRRPTGTVCVENINALPDAVTDVVREAIERRPRPRLILTCLPPATLSGGAAALAAMCPDRVELEPLRNRGAEVAALADRMVRELDPSAEVRLLPSVLEMLGAQSWPGNLHEMKAVLAHALQHRRRGDITVNDLPARYRTASLSRRLSDRERAERDVIVEALRRCEGNKRRAAAELCISRTTLYARMKALRIIDG
ncbi:Fis family transcriptional regulator [Nocardia puris]|uniref:sigma-54-dependent Fis family transcriptional regulator n=1 Tax=Nocardia puris TaxID=208602 RepID=UPI00189620B8|nr:helix-turn-helix domain-containing protein [Nocardia puris]MBF6214017.1 Fis family transcriptional regulator [Nocardia puris]MBF6461601.1 Fis family transcriptional regulator [Nocardia puris]